MTPEIAILAELSALNSYMEILIALQVSNSESHSASIEALHAAEKTQEQLKQNRVTYTKALDLKLINLNGDKL